MVNCACVLRHFKQEISLVEDLASTTTTAKHQWITLNCGFSECDLHLGGGSTKIIAHSSTNTKFLLRKRVLSLNTVA